jgi:hypothetical protein
VKKAIGLSEEFLNSVIEDILKLRDLKCEKIAISGEFETSHGYEAERETEYTITEEDFIFEEKQDEQ